MKSFGFAIIDLSALPRFPSLLIAAADVHRSLDRYHDLRMQLGASLAPPKVAISKLSTGVLLATEVPDGQGV